MRQQPLEDRRAESLAGQFMTSGNGHTRFNKGNFLISFVGLCVALASAFFAYDAVEKQEEIAAIQTYFEIQKLSVQVFENIDQDLTYRKYANGGPGSMNKEELDTAVLIFRRVLYVHYIAFRQHQLKNMSEPNWSLMESALCGIVNSSGGKHYFKAFPVKDAPYVYEFKEVILKCPSSWPNSANPLP